MDGQKDVAVRRKVGRAISRLRAFEVDRLPAGLHADGGGLYLIVRETGTRSWVFRYRVGKSVKDMGLGPAHTVTLASARKKALEARQARLEGVDPAQRRRAAKAAAALEMERAITFDECVDKYIAAHKASWSSEKHAAQWLATLERYATPVIGALAVDAVDTGKVLKVLEPIWAEKTETAGRIRGRIETVLDWAKVRGFRDGENPARWRGHLSQLLPAKGKISKVKHFSALPYHDVPAFMALLKGSGTASRAALRFAILTAARTGEVIGATWAEIDQAATMWTIPAGRMKARREHRVPLSAAALDVLAGMEALRRGAAAPIFPGSHPDLPLSNMAILALLKRMGRTDITTHGFRSAFRDWAAETTDFPSDVIEMALAHTVGDRVENAYRRSDLFERRRGLMDAWGKFCEPPESAETRERRSQADDST